ncbi:hypothetical protein ACYULU_00915 [Breznakiellaceae bacterium SP9]
MKILIDSTIWSKSFRRKPDERNQKIKAELTSIIHTSRVELNKLDKIIDKPVEPVEKMTQAEHWAIFFKYITDTAKRERINKILELEEGIAMASEVLISISRDEVERARLMSEYKGEVDYQSRMVQAKRLERAEVTKEFLSLLDSGKTIEEIKNIYK